MKKWILFMFAFAGLAFAACSNDDVTDGDGGGTGTNADADAWLSVSIKQTSGGTRNLNDPGYLNGTVAESNITTAKAIFFRYTGASSTVPLAQMAPNDFRVVQVVDLNATEIGTPGQSSTSNSGVAGKAFKVSKHVQYILLVANATSSNLSPITAGNITVDENDNVTNITGGSTFTDVNAAIGNTTVSDVIGAEENNFMMTNAKGDLEPSVKTDNSALKTLTTHPTQVQAEASDAAVEITLDRVTSKVRVHSGDGTNQINNNNQVAQVHSFEWILNVTNRSFYPMSARTKTYLEDMNSSNIWSDPYKLGSYRIDPNYTTIENTSANSATFYNTYNASTNPTTIIWKTTGLAEYCLENTQNKVANTQGNTTQVLLKANFAPIDLSLAPNTSLESPYGVAVGQDWLTLGGVIYTYESLMEWMHTELTNKYKDDNSDNFPTAITNELNKYLTQVSATSAVNIPTKTDFIILYGNEGEELTENDIRTGVDVLIEAFKYQKTDITAGTLTDGNLTYYKAGVNYYQIMIKHDNDTDISNNELGEFGVVRNSVYDVYVNSINNPGSPTIPTPDFEKPNEQDEYYLSVRININPWTWYTQVEDL